MRTNPVSWMSLVALVIATLVFAVLTFIQSQSIRTYLGGDGGQDSVPVLQKKVQDQKAAIAKKTADLEAASRELWLLDVKLDQLLANESGTAPAVPTDGKPAPIEIRDSTWQLARHQTEAHSKRISATRDRYESNVWGKHSELEAAVRDRQDELTALGRRIGDEEERFKSDRDQLSRQLDEIATAKEKADRAHREDRSRLTTNAVKLEGEIRKLLELDLTWVSELAPDGTVAEVQGDRVIIGLGSRDGLKPGLRLSVSALVKGIRTGKGMIEVVTVSEAVSTCRILNETDAKRRPIGPGDSVASPVFSRERTPVFAVAGEFKRYTREELASFIRATGAKVADQVGPGVDFLVAGDKSEVEQASARQFQIQAMREDLLMSYVRPVFSASTASR